MFNKFSRVSGGVTFRTLDIWSYPNIYFLRTKDRFDSSSSVLLGVTEPHYEEELFDLMLPEFLRNYCNEKTIPKSDKIHNLQILGFGQNIPKKAESLAKEFGFNKMNILFSDFSSSNLKKEFESNRENHKYSSGLFVTAGEIKYLTQSGKGNIKLVDEKSVWKKFNSIHGGYVTSKDLKFEGELMNTPRHLLRDELDNIILNQNLSEADLEKKLKLNETYLTFVSANDESNGKIHYLSEEAIYLGKSRDEAIHKILFKNPFKKHSGTYRTTEENDMTVLEFKEFKMNNRDWITLENPTLLTLSPAEKEQFSKRYRLN